MATDPRRGGDAGGGGVTAPARVCEPLGGEWDEAAAVLLAPCTVTGTVDAGADALSAARADRETTLYALIDGGELVAVYALRRHGLSLEVPLLAVAEGRRRQGFGRACLADALRRAGKRPLVAEADDATLAFYRAVGFKLVGKRRADDGVTRYRLGWHAPRPAAREA